ncbi:MAG TPA: DUF4286 family protein [Pyrinomonadaceae bacterium]|nr:DUF4286 family protein [Pyrinomonadaceae bacterium]
MVIYEITAAVQPRMVEEYERYMCEQHIPDLLETGYFSGAAFTCATENRYRIRYEAHNKQALDRYLTTEAERLRADFLAHFPSGVELSREVWEVLRVWTADV